jgi:acyl-CoA dehydrogenase
MRPYTDDRREALRERVRAFARAALRRPAGGADPRALARALAGEGLFRLLAPADAGGAAAGVEPLSLVVAREELAWASGLADALFAVQGLCALPLALAGAGEARRRWLAALAGGDAIGAFAVTEPEAGSDLAAVATTARADAGDYVLDGHKTFISNAAFADVFFVLARVVREGAEARAPGEAHAAFVVPREAAGVDTSPLELLGAHAVGAVRLRGVRIPASARLGAEGEGLALTLRTLEVFRPTVGAAACGLAARALDEARRRVEVRRQFGRPLAAHQAVAFAVAERATELEAARGLVYRAAWLKEQALAAGRDERLDTSASMAKLFATETAQRVVDTALQLHGAAGLVKGGVIEALYEEVRALRIYEGTSEMQKLVIARALLRQAP